VVLIAAGALAASLLVRSAVKRGSRVWTDANTLVQAREKRRRFDELLKKDWVTIHLDPRRAGVKLPAQLQLTGDCVLQYGQDMPRPILDLKTTDVGITATLSFSDQPTPTFVPWAAVFWIGDRHGKGHWYREDTPPEVRRVMEKYPQRSE
jgi:hypothetical protein